MNKIPSLYTRDPRDMRWVLRDVNPACQWVMDGEGVPTVKWDGTCVMKDAHGQWWTRHQVRPGKAIPENYIPLETDPVTGKTQGWIPAGQSQYLKFLTEALENTIDAEGLRAGTYELVGPRIGKNPHGLHVPRLRRHGAMRLPYVPTQYDDLAAYLRTGNEAGDYLEGVVWHHPDGRMAKIKARDFPV